jgi:hypothetical protein
MGETAASRSPPRPEHGVRSLRLTGLCRWRTLYRASARGASSYGERYVARAVTGYRSTSFSRLSGEPRPSSGGIRLLSLLPNLKPCEPRGRDGEEQLEAMVSLLRVRGEVGVGVDDTNVRRLAF